MGVIIQKKGQPASMCREKRIIWTHNCFTLHKPNTMMNTAFFSFLIIFEVCPNLKRWPTSFGHKSNTKN